MKICPDCGGALVDSARSCPNCGHAFLPAASPTESLRCPHCRGWIDSSFSVCPYCRRDLRSGGEVPPAPQISASAPTFQTDDGDDPHADDSAGPLGDALAPTPEEVAPLEAPLKRLGREILPDPEPDEDEDEEPAGEMDWERPPAPEDLLRARLLHVEEEPEGQSQSTPSTPQRSQLFESDRLSGQAPEPPEPISPGYERSSNAYPFGTLAESLSDDEADRDEDEAEVEWEEEPQGFLHATPLSEPAPRPADDRDEAGVEWEEEPEVLLRARPLGDLATERASHADYAALRATAEAQASRPTAEVIRRRLSPILILAAILLVTGGLVAGAVFAFRTSPGLLPTSLPQRPQDTPVPTAAIPAAVSPTAIQLPTASVAIAAPQPECISWEEITLEDAGRSLCVYGELKRWFKTDELPFVALFSEDPGTFILVNRQEAPDGMQSGDCVLFEGEIKVMGGTRPYMEFEGQPSACP
jgi:hypothetical protein